MQKRCLQHFKCCFSTMLSNHADHLDKAYGLSENIQVATSTSAFLTFAYVYNGSIMDNMTNSLLPPYAKKPITQLKYGKTFVFSNYFMLASKMYEMLNYKNLSLLCEYQAVASANFYSSKKVVWSHAWVTGNHMITHFEPPKDPITSGSSNGVGGASSPSSDYKSTQSFFFNSSQVHPRNHVLVFLFFHKIYTWMRVNIFPGGFAPAIKEQTKHVSEKTYERKPSVHSFNRNFFNGIDERVHVRVLYYGVFNKYLINFVRTKLKEYTSDILIKYEREAYLSMKKYGYLGEVIASRLSSKDKIMNYLHETNEETMNNLRRYDMENAFKNKMVTYVDDFAFFDDCGKNEQVFERKITYIDIEQINEMDSVDSDDEKDFDEPDDELMIARFH
ncbi:cytoadherence linked asexual protein 3.1, putative [Plasmodium gaboni]|uniref:Cytoadherence linked asexual protein 3.1, putative n=1 Tax=Plasmodium gaboni TaxID=647221 RepID=A0ABY0KW04_9APIC|nr:cytoadherence linked asexual protein 3.1, putative [Plasmodium gaboni]